MPPASKMMGVLPGDPWNDFRTADWISRGRLPLNQEDSESIVPELPGGMTFISGLGVTVLVLETELALFVVTGLVLGAVGTGTTGIVEGITVPAVFAKIGVFISSSESSYLASRGDIGERDDSVSVNEGFRRIVGEIYGI